MRVDQDEQVSRGKRGHAAPGQEWIDNLTRWSLESSFGDATPPPAVWAQIRRRVLQPQWRARHLRPQWRVRQMMTFGGVTSVQQDIGRCTMLSWSDILAHKQRHEDMRREADEYRLIQQALAGRPRRHRFYCRAMDWLGRRMVAWGQRLQERYGAGAAAPAMHAANYAQ